MDHTQARDFGTFIRHHRIAAGLSARQLARRAGVDMSQVVRWEQGRIAYPRAETIAGVARALEVPATDLMSLAGCPAVEPLPSLRPYLRARYRELPPEAVDEVEALVFRLQHEWPEHRPEQPVAVTRTPQAERTIKS